MCPSWQDLHTFFESGTKTFTLKSRHVRCQWAFKAHGGFALMARLIRSLLFCAFALGNLRVGPRL